MNQARLICSTFAISFSLHLIFLLLLIGGSLRFLLPAIPPPPPAVKSLKIVKMTPPPTVTMKTEPEFVPTEPSQQAPHADPNTILESERDTVLRSHERGDQDSLLPQLSGNPAPGLNYTDHPASQPTKSTYTPPAPPVTQTTSTNATKASRPAPSSQPSPSSPPAPNTSTPSTTEIKPAPPVDDPNALPILPPEVKPSDKAKPEPELHPQPTNPATTAAQTKTNPPAPPPSIKSVQIEHSRIDGSRNMEDGDASPSSRESEIGAYKARLYRAIGSAWYIEVERKQAFLAIGEVKIRFYVRANGNVDNIETTDSSGITDVLDPISKLAINKCLPFNVFSDTMKQQLGDGYWEEITFTIY